MWNGKVWAGDHEHYGVSRSQAGEFIACSDPEFSRGQWISDKDWQQLLILIQQCKK